jgi:hypothetical protein
LAGKKNRKNEGEVVDLGGRFGRMNSRRFGAQMTKKDRLALIRKDPSRGDLLGSLNDGGPKPMEKQFSRMRTGSAENRRRANDGSKNFRAIAENLRGRELKTSDKSESSSGESSSSSSSKKTSSDSSSTQPDMAMIGKPLPPVKNEIESESESESSSSDSSSSDNQKDQKKILPGHHLGAKKALLMPESQGVFPSTSTEILSSDATTTTTEDDGRRKNGRRKKTESTTSDCSAFSEEGANKKSKQIIQANNETIFE